MRINVEHSGETQVLTREIKKKVDFTVTLFLSFLSVVQPPPVVSLRFPLSCGFLVQVAIH